MPFLERGQTLEFCFEPLPFFRVRTNVDQQDSIGVGMIPGQSSQAANAGLVPLVVGAGPRTIEYALESVGGPWVGTFTLYITVVGYIM